MKNLNIAKILIDIGAKKGFPLYSPMYGKVTLEEINSDDNYSILVNTGGNLLEVYKADGTYFASDDGECVLFPSKNNRDWLSINNALFNPYDKVLVRESKDAYWKCDLFSDLQEGTYKYHCIGGYFRYCVSYEGNEHLLGTTSEPN